MTLLLVLCGYAVAGPGQTLRSELDRAPATSAAEIPILASLLERAGWTPTPELSGMFEVGMVFFDSGGSHRLLESSCFDVTPVTRPYAGSEMVTQFEAGVGVGVPGMGLARLEGGAIHRVRFHAPRHTTVDLLGLAPTAACEEALEDLSTAMREGSYVVQEVLTAEILEQSQGHLDASGRFVIGSAHGSYVKQRELGSAQPVTVAYRTVPLGDLLAGIETLDLVEEPSAHSALGWHYAAMGTVGVALMTGSEHAYVPIRFDGMVRYLGAQHIGFELSAGVGGWQTEDIFPFAFMDSVALAVGAAHWSMSLGPEHSLLQHPLQGFGFVHLFDLKYTAEYRPWRDEHLMLRFSLAPNLYTAGTRAGGVHVGGSIGYHH